MKGRIVETSQIHRGVDDLIDSSDLSKVKSLIDVEVSDKIHSKQYQQIPHDGILSVSSAVLRASDAKPSCFATGLINPLQSENEVDTDTLYNLGSISKFILMIMTVRLVQQGRMKFSDPIDLYLTNTKLPNTDKITVEHLLGHRSGLKDRDFIRLRESDPITKLSKFKENFAFDLAGEPGINFYYANINFVVVAHMIQKVTGLILQKSFNELIAKEIGTQAYIIDEEAKSMQHASGYKPNAAASRLIDASGHYMFGATGFRATPGEMTKLITAFFTNDEFIQPEFRKKICSSVKDETFEVVTKTDTYRWPVRMGLGIEERAVTMPDGKIKKLFCHGGWQDSHASYLAYCPEDRAAYCICVSKTQSMQRIYDQSHSFSLKPYLFGGALIGAGVLFARVCLQTTTVVGDVAKQMTHKV